MYLLTFVQVLFPNKYYRVGLQQDREVKAVCQALNATVLETLVPLRFQNDSMGDSILVARALLWPKTGRTSDEF